MRWDCFRTTLMFWIQRFVQVWPSSCGHLWELQRTLSRTASCTLTRLEHRVDSMTSVDWCRCWVPLYCSSSSRVLSPDINPSTSPSQASVSRLVKHYLLHWMARRYTGSNKKQIKYVLWWSKDPKIRKYRYKLIYVQYSMYAWWSLYIPFITGL